MIKKYRYEFEYNDDNDDRCLFSLIDFSYCRVCYGSDKSIKCKGRFEDRPDDCPLVEVSE